MGEDTRSPQINSASIPVGGGIAGAIFAGASVMIFLTGIPAIRYFLPAAILLGGGMALAIRLGRHDTAPTARILAVKK